MKQPKDMTLYTTKWTSETLIETLESTTKPYSSSSEWSTADCADYVESVRLRLPLTPIVLGENNKKKMFIIDGNSRAHALLTYKEEFELGRSEFGRSLIPVTVVRTANPDEEVCLNIRRKLNCKGPISAADQTKILLAFEENSKLRSTMLRIIEEWQAHVNHDDPRTAESLTEELKSFSSRLRDLAG